jgi:hypothetical protein
MSNKRYILATTEERACELALNGSGWSIYEDCKKYLQGSIILRCNPKIKIYEINVSAVAINQDPDKLT